MKILIDNSGYELKNHGDLAMLLVAAERFKQSYPDAEINIFTNAPDMLNQLIPYATSVALAGRRQWDMSWNMIGGFHKFLPSGLHSWLDDKEVLFKLKYPHFCRRWIEKRLVKRGYDIGPMQEYLDLVELADIVIATGGGYITDAFEGHASSLLKTLGLAQAYGKPTALFGQGLGPAKNIKLLKLARYVLPKLRLLTLRESVFSEPFAQAVGVSKNITTVTGDDAISLVHSKVPSSLGRAIGVNLRVASYSGVKKHIINDIKRILSSATTHYDTVLRPIPISNHNDDSDITSLHTILPSDALQDISSLDSPQKVIEQVSRCRIVVTGSYHAGVFALSQGISIVGIAASDYYRHKFEGLAFQFGLGCLIVDQESETFSTDLEKAINSSWVNADLVRPILLERAKKQMNKSESAYDNFVKSLIKND